MQAIESTSCCRVVVIAPSTRVDLALPADIPIIDLLPMVLQHTGDLCDDGGSSHGGWRLTRTGHGELDGGRTLRSLDVADGEVLRIAPREERTVIPVFDDIVDAIASARRTRIGTGSVNPGLGAGVIVAAMLTAALTLLRGDRHVVDAYLAGGLALALLGAAAAVNKGCGDRILAVATAASGVPLALVSGLDTVPGPFGRWSLVLGAAAALAYSVTALAALGTGIVVFAASSVGALLTALGALGAALCHLTPIGASAATVAAALAGLSALPKLAVRLARLPSATVPTTNENLQADDIAEVTARTRVAGEYLTGTQIGCAVTIGVAAAVVGSHTAIMSMALGAIAAAASTLRARSVAGRGARIALVGSGVASVLAVVVAMLLLRPADGTAVGLLIVELAVGLLALVLATAPSRPTPSPLTMRLVDVVESAVVVAVVPLAMGVLGLYAVARHR